MTLVAHLFSEIPAQKNMLRRMSKRPCFRGPFTDNKANGSKQCGNLDNSIFTYLLVTAKVLALEKVPFSDTQNPKALC